MCSAGQSLPAEECGSEGVRESANVGVDKAICGKTQ